MLICGHTITDYYYGELNREAGKNLLGGLPPVRNRIYRAEKFVDIDCGGKCLGWSEEENKVSHAADRAQLAAYCLETDEEFYVSRPRGPVEEMMLGESVPGWEPPEVEPPKREPPGMEAPEFPFPEPGSGRIRKLADWAEKRIADRFGEEF